MKFLKAIVPAALVMGMASAAHAQTYLRLTGSTAYRSNVHTAISDLTIWDAGSLKAVYTGSSGLLNSSQVLFTGTTGSGATTITIATSWTGSEAGNEQVSAQLVMPNAQAFLTGVPAGSFAAVSPGGAGGASVAATFQTDTTAADVAMSDTYQSTSQFYNSSLNLDVVPSGASNPVSFPALTSAASGITGSLSGTGIVGIVPFKFCASQGSALTNITQQLAKALWSAGQLSLSEFTSNSADVGTTGVITAGPAGGGNGKWVFASGRNPDSGTRLTALSEIGLGALAPVLQFQPTNGSGAQIVTANSGSIASNLQFPSGVVNYININKSNNGYASGGNLAKAINNPTTSMQFIAAPTSKSILGGQYIAYLGTNDADPQITATSHIVELAYNGVTLGIPGGTLRPDGTYNYNSTSTLLYGAYSFWGYEHMYYNTASPNLISSNPNSANNQLLADSIASQLFTADAVVLFSNMKVTRSGDGGTIR